MKLPPDETVYKITSLARWQRNWINDHRSINYSGLVQELLCQVIKENDPEYYKQFEHIIKNRPSRRIEVTKVFMKNIC